MPRRKGGLPFNLPALCLHDAGIYSCSPVHEPVGIGCAGRQLQQPAQLHRSLDAGLQYMTRQGFQVSELLLHDLHLLRKLHQPANRIFAAGAQIWRHIDEFWCMLKDSVM